MAEYKLAYPAKLSSEDIMLDEVSAILRQHKVSDNQFHRILVSISEAFCNAYLHGNKKDPNTLINIYLSVNETQFSVDIIDQGSGGLAGISNKKPTGPTSENGRGVDIIRHYSDQLEFSETSQGGLKVSMTFNLKSEIDVKT